MEMLLLWIQVKNICLVDLNQKNCQHRTYWVVAAVKDIIKHDYKAFLVVLPKIYFMNPYS